MGSIVVFHFGFGQQKELGVQLSFAANRLKTFCKKLQKLLALHTKRSTRRFS